MSVVSSNASLIKFEEIDLDKDFLNIPIVSIFYDLIPLINPSLYLNKNPQQKIILTIFVQK